MTEDDKNSLVPRKNGGLIQTTGGGRVLSQMVEGTLERVRSREKALGEARFRLAEYEFREPDYLQILRWAHALNQSPEHVLAVLEASKFQSAYDEDLIVKFGVSDGALSSLVWDLDELPLDEFGWHDELRVRTMAFLSSKMALLSYDGSGRLPRGLPLSLRTLVCEGLMLEALDLSAVPHLNTLKCNGNQLADLDLSAVPQLRTLDCTLNNLTDLDVSAVPQLTVLGCDLNQLAELDLSAVPQLKTLDCFDNQLTKLNMSTGPQLFKLNCTGNHLTELDLSAVPQLTTLISDHNELTELDLSAVPQLTTISCSGNQLTELDIRSVRRLRVLYVDRAVKVIGTPPDGCKVGRA